MRWARARPRPTRRKEEEGEGEAMPATLINGSKVELSPQPVFVLGAQSVAKEEITERESGFIRVAADWALGSAPGPPGGV